MKEEYQRVTWRLETFLMWNMDGEGAAKRSPRDICIKSKLTLWKVVHKVEVIGEVFWVKLSVIIYILWLKGVKRKEGMHPLFDTHIQSWVCMSEIVRVSAVRCDHGRERLINKMWQQHSAKVRNLGNSRIRTNLNIVTHFSSPRTIHTLQERKEQRLPSLNIFYSFMISNRFSPGAIYIESV